MTTSSFFEAFRAGAVSCLLKDTDADAVDHAVRSAARGASVIAPSVVRKVVDEFARLSHLDERRLDPESARLSKRDRGSQASCPRSVEKKETATRLNTGHGTVRNHPTNLYRKLHVTDRFQAAMRAREYSIVRARSPTDHPRWTANITNLLHHDTSPIANPAAR